MQLTCECGVIVRTHDRGSLVREIKTHAEVAHGVILTSEVAERLVFDRAAGVTDDDHPVQSGSGVV